VIYILLSWLLKAKVDFYILRFLGLI